MTERSEGMELSRPPGSLSDWRWIVVNSSGGKDSQTALRIVVEGCDRKGVDRSRIVVSHQCLGKREWKGTLDLVMRQAAHYGLRVEVSRYRDKNREEKDLLDYVRKRGKWPDNKNRYCTSEFKRGPGGRVIVKLFRESPGPVLNVYGFRADESPARAKKKPFLRNARFSSGQREVWDWCPLLHWSEGEVWRSIRESGVPHHAAYDLGMPRLSCVFCIFAPRAALMIAGRSNPELLDEYCQVEEEIGHTFQNGRAIREIRDAIDAGETVTETELHGAWNM
jgi:3'-phosphoadenosine 5'-phosphosulfate sulfotransferase (PAPS reductase)/FAD synthetase